MEIGIHRAVRAHGHDHGRNVGSLHLGRNNGDHFRRGLAGIVVGKQDSRLLLVADKAVRGLKKIPSFQGDAHVRHHGVDRLSVLLRQPEGALDDLLVHVDLNDDAVRVLENLVAVLLQRVGNGQQVRPLGDGRCHIPVVVEDRQPGSHAVSGLADIVGVHPVAFQLAHNIHAGSAVVHETDKGGAKLAVCDVLRHIPPDAAVNLLHAPSVPPSGDKRRRGIPLDIHKHRADDNHSHDKPSIFLRILRLLYHSISILQQSAFSFSGKRLQKVILSGIMKPLSTRPPRR